MKPVLPVLLLLAASSGFAQCPVPRTPEEIHSLVQEVVQRQRRLDGHPEDYVSTVKTFTRYYDRKNQLTSSTTETYEHFPAHPKSLVIQLEKDGVPSPPARVAREREKALKGMEQYLQWLKTSKGPGEAENVPGFRLFLGVYAILRNSDLYAAGQDTLDGRPMVTLQFRPKAGWTDPKGLVHKLSGTLWIDAQDKVVALAKAWPATQSSAEGLFFEMYHKKVFGDTWALVFYRLNPALNPDMFLKERFDWSFANSDFQKFTVETGTLTRSMS